MAVANEAVLVVKHTFLEFVNDGCGGSTGRSRCRTMSDTGFHLPETPQACHTSDLKSFKLAPDDDTASTRDGVDSEDPRFSKSCSHSSSSQLQSWADEVPGNHIEISGERTTVMFRNVPNDYSRDTLTQMIDAEGFHGKYNFIYLPVDFRSKSGFGYAFINFVNGKVAEEFKQSFNGFAEWTMPSQKVAEVTWSHPSQGLEIHIERYRNSPVMHEAVPDAFKPAMFENGKRIAFPPPTKAIRMPRIRQSGKR